MSTEAEAVANLAMTASEPARIEPGSLYNVIVPAGGFTERIDLTGPEFESAPSRKRGSFRVHDADTLINYLHKHGRECTEVWADRGRQDLVAVINGHGGSPDDTGWGDHRAWLEILRTRAWQAWAALDGKLLDQSTFAQHIEDRAVDIIDPDAASMLEIAQSITATIGVSFDSSKRLSNGETQLQYRQNIEAKAGQRGQLDIPSRIELALRPFEGADPYKVVARFRYRITDGVLRLAFALERPEDVLTNAFDAIVDAVSDAIEHPVFRGVPA